MKLSSSIVLLALSLASTQAAPLKPSADIIKELTADVAALEAAVPAQWSEYFEAVPESEGQAVLPLLTKKFSSQEEAEQAFRRAAPVLASKLDSLKKSLESTVSSMSAEPKAYFKKAREVVEAIQAECIRVEGLPSTAFLDEKTSALSKAVSSLSPAAHAEIRSAFPTAFRFFEDARVEKVIKKWIGKALADAA